MFNDRRKRRRAGAVAAQGQQALAILRPALTVMLPLWLVYFFGIKLFAKNLNAITVPVLDLPLGTTLAIQGSVLAFTAILVLLTRAYAAASRQ